NITERSELSNVFNSILLEIAFKEIVKTIETISDEKDPKDSTGKTFVRTREDTLQRINTYVSSANTPDNTDFDSKGNVQYKPYLKKGQFILVNFSGLGSEIKGEHPAIVWEVDPYWDRVLIIPCTSFDDCTTVEYKNFFNIGHIKFYNRDTTGTYIPSGPGQHLHKQTIVDVTQIQAISRKRIKESRWRNKSAKSKWQIVRLDDEQIQRVEEGLKIHILKEQTLLEKEIYKYPNCIPVLTHPLQFKHLYRLYNLEPETTKEKLVYSLLHDPKKKYTIYRKPAKTGINVKSLLTKWLKAEGTNKMNSEQARQIAYTSLQEAIEKIS
ncbi:type II toxin-antitoxin system PemK/MazF family toxin, partial [Bacillus paranthracis]|uniref:type II toxin-antitoxin system PemK/MazF family toxin n=1 Tax=Bacillus paranthracis TaxID=2026186 RepID=UPI002E21FC79|nr:type II toxin-antitoxin system PemK/MazF family toxin [Bacillus paranthracis]